MRKLKPLQLLTLLIIVGFILTLQDVKTWLVEQLFEKLANQVLKNQIGNIIDNTSKEPLLLTAILMLLVVLSVLIFLASEKILNILLRENSETTSRPTQRRIIGSVKSELLEDVKSEVKGRLRRALHNAALIKIRKEEKNSQVKTPWDMEVKAGKKSSFQFEETSIIEVFDHSEIAGKLLILGAPGAGKTTTLLELARDLCDRAVDNPNEPIPVLFNLSAWTDDKQAIADWLVAELKEKRGVRIDIGRQLLEERQLLPLLDGLDELASEYQERCLQAINQFQQNCHPKHLVVCCRLKEYENTNTLLQLNGAVYLKPLEPEQIRKYLVSLKQRPLWQIIHKDQDLMALAKTPLLLSILTLAYEKISIQELQALNTIQERQQYLFKKYVESMLAQEIDYPPYAKGKEPTSEQTRHWLTWLAKILEQKEEFLIEKLQPTWLRPPQKLIYRLGIDLIGGLIGGFISALAVGPSVGLIGGFIGGLTVWLISELSEGLREDVIEGLPEGLDVWLIGGLKAGLIYGLVVGLIGGLVVAIANGFTGGLMSSLGEGLIVGFTGGLISGLIGGFIGLVVGLIGKLTQKIEPVKEDLKSSVTKARNGLAFRLRDLLIVSLIFGLLFGSWQGLNQGLSAGLIGGLVSGLIVELLIVELRQTVKPVETLKWDWTKARSGLNIGLRNGFIIGLIGGLIGQLNEGLLRGLIFGLFFSSIFGVIGGLMGLLINGFSGPDIERRTIPNQGIWQSTINIGVFAPIGSLASGLIGGLISGLTIGLDQGLQSALIIGLKNALIVGLTGGLIGGLFPGTACIQHLMLRIILCWSGLIPWNYARFLNYATKRLFLERIGGRYQFIHPWLQDHFAQSTIALGEK